MFELEKIFRFEAGHRLCHHDGKCSKPHGHSYVLTVRVSGEELIPSGPKTNMIIDFYDIKKIVTHMIDTYFDHRDVNETLHNDSPTAEFMAKWIYEYLQPQLPGLSSITLQETNTARVTYRPS